MTNKDIILDKLSNDVEYLAKSLILAEYDGFGIYQKSINGMRYEFKDRKKCIEDTIEWLMKEVK